MALERLAAGSELLEQAFFSLDLKNGRPLGDAWHAMAPLEIAHLAHRLGFRRLLVLDLAAVGTGAGPASLPLCRQIRAALPSIRLATGGGVRQMADVRQLLAAGCDWVLIASALHDGRITPEQLHAASCRPSSSG